MHRLDRDTSGVLVLAKHVDAQRKLSEQWFEREVEKQYAAIVRGTPLDDSGLIHAAIAEHPRTAGKMIVSDAGKPAQTRWRVVERLGIAALLHCWPLTGRQHQIRVHLQLIGLPLLVDPLYAGTEAFRLSEVKSDYHASSRHQERPLIARLTLHAEAITLRHPRNGRPLHIEAPLPKDFRAVLTQLRKQAAVGPGG